MAQFTVHLEGVVVNTQFSAKLWHLFQVRAIRVIILTSDCDVQPIEHVRITLASGQGNGLRERVLRVAAEELIDFGFRVKSLNAWVALTCLCTLVAT